MPAGDAFSERDLREVGREVRAVSAEAQVLFSVLVADPDDLAATPEQPALAGDSRVAGELDTRALAEQAHAALGDPAREAVLILVSPRAHRVEVVMGSGLHGRLSDRDCALAALSMTSSFAGGDLTGGIVQGVRMLGQRVRSPRRAGSHV